MRRRVDVAVGRAHRDAERVADLGDRGVPTPRRSARGREGSRARRRRPRSSLRAGGCWCSCRRTRRSPRATSCRRTRRCRARRDSCWSQSTIEQVAVAVGALVDVARRAALDPVRLRDRLRRDRIERERPVRSRSRRRRSRPSSRTSRPASAARRRRRRTACRRSRRCRATPRRRSRDAALRVAVVDEGDEARRVRVDRRGRDVGVPPVVGREERQRPRRADSSRGAMAASRIPRTAQSPRAVPAAKTSDRRRGEDGRASSCQLFRPPDRRNRLWAAHAPANTARKASNRARRRPVLLRPARPVAQGLRDPTLSGQVAVLKIDRCDSDHHL